MSQNRKPKYALGRHMTIEFYECNTQVLLDVRQMECLFRKAADDSGATIMSSHFHDFEPQGVSGVVIIAESHFAVHAWPEHDYAAVDVFTCGDCIDFERAVESLKDSLDSGHAVISSDMNRGIVSNNGVERSVPIGESDTHVYTMSWERKFEKSRAWGMSVSLDIYGCRSESVKDESVIKRFCSAASSYAGQDACEDPVVTVEDNRFFTGGVLSQRLQGAMIVGHIDYETNAVYMDIISCKFFEPRIAAEFALSFFSGSHYKMQTALRR